MNAEIIAVGSELLTADKIDTNSLFLTRQLNTIGAEVVQKSIVGDERARLTEAISAAMGRSQIVILTGGLGPTEDDVTRDAAAAAFGRPLVFHQEIYDEIEARFRRMLRKMADNNKRQAFLIEGAEILPNPRGTAPGQYVQVEGGVLILLPGPPKELMPLFENECVPRLRALFPPLAIRTLHMRVAGMGESDLDRLIAPIYTRYSNPVTTILAGAGDLHIHLRARCTSADEAQELVSDLGRQIQEVLGDRVYTQEGHELEEVIRQKLAARGATVATAESCTGGLVAERLTAMPGSSATFSGGLVTYSEELKTRMLGIDPELLRTEGAVSEAVARGMAIGVRERLQSTFGLSTTGFAGPDGGTENAPVGTIYVGVATPDTCEVKRFQFVGDRSRVRMLAAQFALDLLRRSL